jgi:cytochrome c peroxidase
MKTAMLSLRAKARIAAILGALYAVVPTVGLAGEPAELSPLQQLGKFLYFDKNLSSPPGQSCANALHLIPACISFG